jgi:hypothetical protein
LVPNAAVALLMLAIGVGAAALAGLDSRPVYLPYLQTYAAVTLVCTLAWAFAIIARLATVRADQPLRKVIQALRPRLPLLLLPALIAPLFLAGYTTAKTSMSRLISFRWDALFSDMDAWIFRSDPWRLTHALIGPSMTPWLESFYTLVWGFTLVMTSAFVALIGNSKLVGRYFLTSSLAWMIGGVVLAYLFSSAGPIFAAHFDPALADRFAPLREALDRTLSEDSSVRRTQAYLLRELSLSFVAKGGGISAMPSMHLAAATLYILAARGTRWIIPAWLFFALTFLGSVHFGYHYAVDMPLAVLVTVICWKITGLVYGRDWFPRPKDLGCQPA